MGIAALQVIGAATVVGYFAQDWRTVLAAVFVVLIAGMVAYVDDALQSDGRR